MSRKIEARRLPDTEAIRDMRIAADGDPSHDGGLFLLSEPQSFERGPNAAITTDIVWVSSICDRESEFYQTHVFPVALNTSNPAGFDVLSWSELPGSLDGIADVQAGLNSFLQCLEDK